MMQVILHTDDQRRRRFPYAMAAVNRLAAVGQIRPALPYCAGVARSQKTALMQEREIVVGKIAAAVKLCRLFWPSADECGLAAVTSHLRPQAAERNASRCALLNRAR